MQTGYYLRLFGPSFVYVKFRCSRCKKLGEQFVKQEDWEDGILKDIPSEITQTEKDGLQVMGPISVNEQINFHFDLDSGEALKELACQVHLEPPASAEAETTAEAETKPQG
jgi:hypothetical protein